jgi:hypothetical protein
MSPDLEIFEVHESGLGDVLQAARVHEEVIGAVGVAVALHEKISPSIRICRLRADDACSAGLFCVHGENLLGWASVTSPDVDDDLADG